MKSQKTNWKKVDKHLCETLVEQKLRKTKTSLDQCSNQAEVIIDTFTTVVNEAVSEIIPKRKIWTSKPKLKVWTPEISANLKLLRSSMQIWN